MRYFVCLGKGAFEDAREVETVNPEDAVDRFTKESGDDLNTLLGETTRVYSLREEGVLEKPCPITRKVYEATASPPTKPS